MRQFTIEGEKTYWGDKCSDRYRKRAKVDKEPVIDDLVAFRERALLAPYEAAVGARRRTARPPSACRAAMYTYDRLPFWATFFADARACGPCSRRRATAASARRGWTPPWPSRASPSAWRTATSQWLAEQGVDYIFLPNQINEETEFPRVQLARLPVGPDAALRGAHGAAASSSTASSS